MDVDVRRIARGVLFGVIILGLLEVVAGCVVDGEARIRVCAPEKLVSACET